MAECTRCSATIAADASFCGKCGAPVGDGQGPPTTLSATPDLLVVVSATELIGLASRHGEVLKTSPGDALYDTQKRLAEGPKPEAVLLLGSDRSIPFACFEDYCGFDEAVLSDLPFGTSSTPSDEDRYAGALLPDCPVGRIPTDDLGEATAWLDRRELRAGWAGGVAASATVWSTASRAVLESIAGPEAPELHLVPPAGRDQLAGAFSPSCGRAYFNLHGTDQEPIWLGEGDGGYPVAVDAAAIEISSGAIISSEACYGAALIDGSRSLSRQFLARGAGAFYGSTIIAWGGGPGSPPCLADRMVEDFWHGLDAGLTAGEAWLETLAGFLDDVDLPLSPPEHNTAAAFVLYGHPLAAVPGASKSRRRRPVARARGQIKGVGSVLDRVRDRMRDQGDDVLARTRRRLQGRLEESTWRVFSQGRLGLAAALEQSAAPQGTGEHLERLLGSHPTDTRLVTVIGPSSFHTLLANHGRKHVALTYTAAGLVCEALSKTS